MQTYQNHIDRQTLNAAAAVLIGGLFGWNCTSSYGWLLSSIGSLVLLYGALNSSIFRKAAKAFSPKFNPFLIVAFWTAITLALVVVTDQWIPPLLAAAILYKSLKNPDEINPLDPAGLRLTCLGIVSALMVLLPIQIVYWWPTFITRRVDVSQLTGVVFASLAGWFSLFYWLKKSQLRWKDSRFSNHLPLYHSLKHPLKIDALSPASLRNTCLGILSALLVFLPLKIMHILPPVASSLEDDKIFYVQLVCYILTSLAGWFWLFYFLKKAQLKRKSYKQYDELWSEAAFYGLFGCFVLLVGILSFADHGLGNALQVWLNASVLDANIGVSSAEQGRWFGSFLKSVMAISIFAAFAPVATKVCSILTCFVQRFATTPGGTTPTDAFLDAMRTKTRELVLQEETPWITNMARTFWWICFCYLLIFSLVLFCPYAQVSFFLHWQVVHHGLPWIEKIPHVRPFFAALAALYGTVPIAVSSIVFLPNTKPPQISISREGALFPKRFLPSLQLRPLRLWSDFKSVSLVKAKSKTVVRIDFKSGGYCHFNPARMSKEDLDELLTVIDELSLDCEQSADILALRTEIQKDLPKKKYGDKREVTKVANSNYRSTISGSLMSIVIDSCSLLSKVSGDSA